ncbi:MAG: RHS repeat-associated core domain-containing protein [Myxococcota bacterium]
MAARRVLAMEPRLTLRSPCSLQDVELSDGRTVDYRIGPNNRRIGRVLRNSAGGVLDERYWVYRDALNPIAELDAQGNITARFVYASKGHVPDYMVKGGTTYRLITDHLGSVRLVVNASTGAIAQKLRYDAFGQVLEDTNPGFQPFGFAGGLYDPATELVRFGARDYDPHTGRWTASDPIGFAGGDGNLYAYVGGDPVNLVDPSGLLFNFATGAGGAVLGGIANGVYAASQGNSFWEGAAVGATAGAAAGFTLNPFVVAPIVAAGTSLGNSYVVENNGKLSDVNHQVAAEKAVASACVAVVTGPLVGKGVGGAVPVAHAEIASAIGSTTAGIVASTAIGWWEALDRWSNSFAGEQPREIR